MIAVFTPTRWAYFRLCLDEVDDHLYRLSHGEDVTCWVVRIGDERRASRRPPQMVGLYSARRDKLQTQQDRYHATTIRMVKLERCHTQVTTHQLHCKQIHSVLLQPRPHNFVGCRCLSRVQSFSSAA